MTGYIACQNCKYNREDECEFYSMGSGLEMDMPCYREKELIRRAAKYIIEGLSDKNTRRD